MDWKDLTHGILFLIEITMVVTAIVKVVTKMETTSALLGQRLEYLGEKIEDFSTVVAHLHNRTDDHHDRIVKVEAKLDETAKQSVRRR